MVQVSYTQKWNMSDTTQATAFKPYCNVRKKFHHLFIYLYFVSKCANISKGLLYYVFIFINTFLKKKKKL